MNLPKPPQTGQPVSPDWGRSVCDALRRQQLTAGPGIKLTKTPGGTIVAAKKTTARDADPGEQTVLARITSGSAASGYSVDLYADGLGKASTGTSTLFLTDVAADAYADLVVGTVVVAHPAMTHSIVGGGA